MIRVQNFDGLEFACASEKSVEQWDIVVESYAAYARDVGRQLKLLLEIDPNMPMAMCMKGYFGKMMGNQAQSGRAREMLDRIFGKYSADDMSSREWLHVKALQAWCAGQNDEAVGFWEDILSQWPGDFVALRLAHFSHFYSGESEHIRDSVRRVLQHYGPEHPYHGYVLGMYAFGLEECGEYREAENFGRKAVDINPADAWSVHAVAHVMEMEERRQEGIEWVASTEAHWSTVNNFRFHLYWHQALYYLEQGEFDAVLKLYDNQVASDLDSEFYLDMCNAASLLWRLELHGQDVGSRWSSLAETARSHVNDQELVFVSLHYLMALSGAGDQDSANDLLDVLRSWRDSGTTQGTVLGDVGLDIAAAVIASRNRDYDLGYKLLEGIGGSMSLIGGSKAQQDLFTMIMLDSAVHAAGKNQVSELLKNRISQRPQSPWGKYMLAQAEALA